ncbi:MAG: PAS domain S-box protein [Magnetococcus sp. WYHC-3]
MITDRAGIIQYVNPQFSRLTGFSGNEVLGQNPRILQSGRVRGHTYSELWETISTGNAWNGVLLNRHKDGHTYWERQTITPLHDERGEITHFLAIKEDISQARRMESQLKRAKSAAESANLLKDAFLARIALELVEPIRLQDSGLKTLWRHMERQGEEWPGVADIQSGAGRIRRLSMNLSELARIGADTFLLEHTPFNLHRLFDQIAALFAEKCALKGTVTFTMDLDPETVPETVAGDPLRLRRCLANVLGHALQTTAAGFIHMGVVFGEHEDARMRWMRVTLRDSGGGLSEAEMRALLQPGGSDGFQSAELISGASLAVMVTRRIVELMGGHIDAGPNPDSAGTWLELAIPLEIPLNLRSEERPRGDASDPALGRNLNALVIGENPVNRLLMERLLVSLGMTAMGLDRCDEIPAFLPGSSQSRIGLIFLDCSTECLPWQGDNSGKILRQRGMERIPILVCGNTTPDGTPLADALPQDARLHFIPAPLRASQARPMVLKILRSWSGPGAGNEGTAPSPTPTPAEGHAEHL